MSGKQKLEVSEREQKLLDQLRIYICETCRQPKWFNDGAADDMPGSCDDCWAKAHAGSTASNDSVSSQRDSKPQPEPATTEFDPDHPRPYRWVFVVTVEASETPVADGFDPFDPERVADPYVGPYEVLDHIVGNVDTWGESHIEIVEARPLAVPPREHIRRAQSGSPDGDVSERDRKVIAETLGRLLDTDGMTIERLQEFCAALHMDTDGDHVKMVRETIDSIEHPDC